MALLFMKLRAMRRQDGGAFPDRFLNLAWDTPSRWTPRPSELLREISSKALADVLAPADPQPGRAAHGCWSRPGGRCRALPCCATMAPPPAALDLLGLLGGRAA